MSDKTLPAWSIHDDPGEHCHWDERNWLAVAAESEEHARVLAAAFNQGEAPRDEFDWKTAFVIRGPIDTTIWPERLQPQYPQLIRDPECLRLLGWCDDGERDCESCGLASMGLDQYAICDNCDCCKECCDCVVCESCDLRFDLCECEKPEEVPSLEEWLDRWEAMVLAGQSSISREEAEKRYYETYGPAAIYPDE